MPMAPRAGSAHAHGEKAYNDRVGRAGALPFGLITVAILLWWAAAGGGYAPTTWYPGALLFLALLAVVAVSPSRREGPTPRTRAAIALLTAFTAWSFLSIAWAGVQGDAWDGANRTLLYAAVYATFALLCWRTPEAVLVLGLFVLGTAAIGGLALATEGVEAFNGNRLAAPTGYENASAALFLMAFWPALALAARPEVHWAARSLLLAAGGLLLQLAFLAQSRGSLVAGGVALLVLVLVSRDRLRLLAVLLLVSAAVAATLVPLLDIVAAGSEAEVRQAVGAERVAVALSTLALFLMGALIFFVGQTGRIRRGLPQLTRPSTGCGSRGSRSRARRSLRSRGGVARRRAAPGPGDRSVRHVASCRRRSRRPSLARRGRRQLRSRLRQGAHHGRGAALPSQPRAEDLLPDRPRRRRALPRLRGGGARRRAAPSAGARLAPRRRRRSFACIRRLLARPRLDRLAVGDPRARGLRARLVGAGRGPCAIDSSRSRPRTSPLGSDARRRSGALRPRRRLARVAGPGGDRARTGRSGVAGRPTGLSRTSNAPTG